MNVLRKLEEVTGKAGEELVQAVEDMRRAVESPLVLTTTVTVLVVGGAPRIVLASNCPQHPALMRAMGAALQQVSTEYMSQAAQVELLTKLQENGSNEQRGTDEENARTQEGEGGSGE